jgi:hypothetical protein
MQGNTAEQRFTQMYETLRLNATLVHEFGAALPLQPRRENNVDVCWAV